jgi:hypothetical protein
MKIWMGTFRNLSRSRSALTALILAGLAFQTSATPILVGEGYLGNNQSILPLETVRSLVATYNASHDPRLADLPMPESITKSGRYGSARVGGEGKADTGYFLVKTDRADKHSKVVKLFYSVESRDDSASGSVSGSPGGSVHGSSKDLGNGSAAVATPASGPQTAGKNREGAFKPSAGNEKPPGDHKSSPHPLHSNPTPQTVPDAGGTLAFLAMAGGSLELIRRKFGR